MQGELSAIGDTVTGALGARAVEPRAGEAPHGQGGGLCLNCGTRLEGAYCYACGQSAEVHRSVGAIGHEIAHGVFHFEGKLWRALPMLLLHPGALTRRYVAGERARFISPLALFLFTVFLLFATISWVGWDGSDAVAETRSAANQVKTARAIDQAGSELAAAQRLRGQLLAAHRPTHDVDAQIGALQATIDGLGLFEAGAGGRSGRGTDYRFRTGWPRLDAGLRKATDDPPLALYKLQSSAYKYSWLLIILSTPFVAMLFLWRRRFTLYDHAIFVTYSIAFMMLLTIVLTIAGAVGLRGAWIALVVVAAPPIHIFAQLRGAYALRWPSAAWRTVLLLGFAFAVLGVFAVLLLAHGLMD